MDTIGKTIDKIHVAGTIRGLVAASESKVMVKMDTTYPIAGGAISVLRLDESSSRVTLAPAYRSLAIRAME